MNIFVKQMSRKWMFSTAIILLLSLAVSFSCVGGDTWISIQKQMKNISTEYTTIAVSLPIDRDYMIRQHQKGLYFSEDGNYHWMDGTLTYGKENIASFAKQAPQAIRAENSGILSAGLIGLKGLASGSDEMNQYNEAFDCMNYGFCVLAVKCVQVEDISIKGYAEEGMKHIGKTTYIADFEVMECVSLMDSYGDLAGERVRIGGGVAEYCLTEGDGRIPFEEGKTYLVRGFFRDLPYKVEYGQAHKKQAEEDIQREIVRSVELCARGIYDSKNLSAEQWELNNSDVDWYYMAMEGSLPYYCEYTGEPQEFLNTEEGKVWRDIIIPWTRLNQNSAALVLTDNLYSSYNFNEGIASIMEGRAFTEEEYAQGSDVCIVSAGFAKYNNLTVGDIVTAELYDTDMCEYEIYEETGWLTTYQDYIYLRRPMVREDSLGVQKSYKIVGIYTAPEFSGGQYNFTADTIFAPKKSVKNAEQYEEPDVAYLNSLVLKGGSQDEFEAYMAKQGMGGNYTYLDMGFEEVLPALEMMENNAVRLAGIGGAVFLLVSAVSFYLLANRMKSVARGVSLIGEKQKSIWKQLMAVFCTVVVVAAFIGTVSGLIVSNIVLRENFKIGAIAGADNAYGAFPVLLLAGTEAVLLITVAMVICWSISKQDLMGSNNGYKKSVKR